MPTGSVLAWIVVMLAVDHQYYWFHRASHRVGFLWAVHSVHHLADPKSAADCSVLSGSQGLAWGAAEPVGTDGPRLDVSAAPPVRSEHRPWWQVYRPGPGRAPPA